MQDFHQNLFQLSSDPLRKEIKRITGLEICEDAKNKATAAVQVFSDRDGGSRCSYSPVTCLRTVGKALEPLDDRERRENMVSRVPRHTLQTPQERHWQALSRSGGESAVGGDDQAQASNLEKFTCKATLSLSVANSCA